ncbi:MAG: SDR family NAD(P)-dependent oxidoreductase [Pseudomonadota bacterium]
MKFAVITGSTGGLGKEITILLAHSGWNLILVNRSKSSAENQLQALTHNLPNQTFVSYEANLMDINEIRNVANQINASGASIQMLYNVAGVLTDKEMMSTQGYESHFAVNTLAPYILILSLRENLKNASSERRSVIVNFSTSTVQSIKTLNVESLPKPAYIGGLMGAYASSKLALDVVTCFLKEELLSQGILIQSVDPGPTKSPMTSGNNAMPWFLRLLQPILFKSASVQANKLVNGVEQAVSQAKTGLWISEGRVKNMPEIARRRETQSELRLLLDNIVRSKDTAKSHYEQSS